jgi:DNA-directed RNA polymerase subunit M/transcription elongation factor TFIIS
MQFCPLCNNMLYLELAVKGEGEAEEKDDYDLLQYFCRNCFYQEDLDIKKQAIVVSNYDLKKSEQEFSHIINKYTKLDPTLPRVNNILCPNDRCKTNTTTTEPKEIIYIRYDDINLKYVYLCSTCDTVWKTEPNT